MSEAYARKVYGNIGEQNATGGHNLIDSKYVSNFSGGNKKGKKSKGGDMLSSLAVPAIFLTANHLYKNRRNFTSKYGKSKKYNNYRNRFRKTRRFQRRR